MKPVLCVLGKSGSGKSALCTELEKRYGLKAIPSYTTRPKRNENESGHTFITEEEFRKLKDLVAYAETDSCRYGVTKEMFEDEQYSIYVIDLTGLKYLIENYHGERTIISLYIDCDVCDRFSHMMLREDDRTDKEKKSAALKRIEHDAVEFEHDKVMSVVNFVAKNKEGKFNSLVDWVAHICEGYRIIEAVKP